MLFTTHMHGFYASFYFIAVGFTSHSSLQLGCSGKTTINQFCGFICFVFIKKKLHMLIFAAKFLVNHCLFRRDEYKKYKITVKPIFFLIKQKICGFFNHKKNLILTIIFLLFGFFSSETNQEFIKTWRKTNKRKKTNE